MLMADNSYRDIKDVQKGEKIMTMDRETLKLRESRVVAVEESFQSESTVVRLKHGVEVESSGNHLLFCEDGAFRLVRAKNTNEFSLTMG